MFQKHMQAYAEAKGESIRQGCGQIFGGVREGPRPVQVELVAFWVHIIASRRRYFSMSVAFTNEPCTPSLPAFRVSSLRVFRGPRAHRHCSKRSWQVRQSDTAGFSQADHRPQVCRHTMRTLACLGCTCRLVQSCSKVAVRFLCSAVSRIT